MFSGLMSRWMMSSRWATASADASCSSIEAVASSDHGVLPINAQIAAQPAHDKVCAIGIAPVIIEGNNVRMFQPCNGLGLDLKPANEVRLVSVFRKDNLDGYIAPD